MKQQGQPSAAGLAEIGLLLESQGKTPQAIECFEKSLELEPSNKVLKQKIASLISRPKARDERKAVASVDDVFRRYGATESSKIEENTLRPPVRSHIVASHSLAEEDKVEDTKERAEKLFHNKEPLFDEWKSDL